MLFRRQLPVHSSVASRALPVSAWAAFTRRTPAFGELKFLLADRFGATAVALTDSGTSALVWALRLALPRTGGGTVALPAYGCPDLLSAAVAANATIRLYDTDPHTLSPDLASVERVLREGAQVIVVTHLYGYAADVPGVQALAVAHGAVVIEDAAQAASGSLQGKRLGTFGPLTVLSFGRGKGVTGGGGGALLAVDEQYAARVRGLPPSAERAGWSNWAGAALQWSVGRPSLYALPSALPFLHLGETRYHEPHEPHALSAAAASLVTDAFKRVDDERAQRVETAQAWRRQLVETTGLAAIQPIQDSRPGYLRFAARDTQVRELAAALGVVRGYPRCLDAYPASRAVLRGEGATACPGAAALLNTLITLPTHQYVTSRDITRVVKWGRR